MAGLSSPSEEVPLAAALWQELAAMGRILPDWVDNPRRHFLVRRRCPACPEARKTGAMFCGRCDGNGFSLRVRHPPTRESVRWALPRLQDMAMAEVLAERALELYEPAPEPRALYWYVGGWRAVGYPHMLRVLDEALADKLGQKRVLLGPIASQARWTAALGALQRVFVQAGEGESPVAPLLVLGDLGFRLLDAHAQHLVLARVKA